MMRKGKELSQDSQAAQQWHRFGSSLISQLLNVTISFAEVIIRKWKEYHSTDYIQELLKRFPTCQYNGSQRSCGRSTGKELQEELETSPRKTQLLKEKQVEACVKFATNPLVKLVDHRKNVVWSDETKMKLYRNDFQMTLDIKKYEFGGGSIILLGLFLFSWYREKLVSLYRKGHLSDHCKQMLLNQHAQSLKVITVKFL